MDPQLYIQFATLLQALRFDEWVGLSYAHDYATANDKPYRYPVPPDTWDNITGPPWPENNQPPANAFSYFYSRSVPISPNPQIDAGAVYVLYDEVVRFAVAALTLSDGIEYSFDITTNAKTLEQLSVEAQAAVAPPPEE